MSIKIKNIRCKFTTDVAMLSTSERFHLIGYSTTLLCISASVAVCESQRGLCGCVLVCMYMLVLQVDRNLKVL